MPTPSPLRALLCPRAALRAVQGVLLSHSQVLHTIESKLTFLRALVPSSDHPDMLGPNDCYISFLPLAHIFDRSAPRAAAPMHVAFSGCRLPVWHP